MRRAAPAPGRPRVPAARRGLHVGHGPVAADDAVGARGDVRGRRARPPRRGRRCGGSIRCTGSAGPASPSTSTSRRPGAAARGGGEVLRRRRGAGGAVPRGAARRSTSRASSPPGAAPSSRRRLRAARAAHGAARRAAPAARVRRALLRAPAGARGVLVPLAVHRRRPVPRARDLRARWSTSRCSTAAGTPTAACTRVVEAMARPLDVRCGEPVGARSSTRAAA